MNSVHEMLHRCMSGYMQSSLLGTLAELDIVTVILRNGGFLSAKHIAAACDCDVRAMECVLDALASQRYLTKTGPNGEAVYGVVEEYKDCLDSRSPESSIPMLRHLATCQTVWARLSWTLKSGKKNRRISRVFSVRKRTVSRLSAG